MLGPAIASLVASCTVPTQALPSPTLLASPTPKIEFVLAENPTVTMPVLTTTGILEANQTATLPMNTPAPTTTLEAIPIDCGSLEVPRCSLRQAEALAGFEVRAPTRLPEGLKFLGTIAEPGTSSTLVYGCGEGCRLTIYQQIWEEDKSWVFEGNLKGEYVPIGPHTGVYAAGPYKTESESTGQTVDAGTGTQMLAWEDHFGESKYGFRIDQFSPLAESSLLDREDLIELAYDTVGVPFPTGLIAFESNRDGNAEIYAMRFHSKERFNLTKHPADDFSFAWSPDGERIAFLSDRSGRVGVYVMQADGSDVRSLTEGSGVDWVGPPAWSADGARLALTEMAPEHGEGASLVYLVNTDGSGYSELSYSPIASGPVFTSQPLQWSPDEKWVAYSEYFLDPESGATLPYPTSSGLKAIAVEGGRRIKLSGRENKYVASFAWSPDGTKLAYAWMDDPLLLHDFHIAIANADGSDPNNITLPEDAFPPSDLAWSPDGSLLAMVRGVNGQSGLVVYDYQEDGIAVNLDAFYASEVSRLSWSPTGMQILYALERDIYAEHHQWIVAALLEGKYWLPLESRLALVQTIGLERSDARTGDNGYPQWQPRP